MKKLPLALLGVAAAGVAGYKLAVEPWWHSWGIVPEEAARALPGDELIPEAMSSETRGITIAATPEAIWPWLVQMGFGRAGWYSYDAIDMSHASAHEVIPSLQELKVGDLLPVAPGAGFEVRVLEPNRALALFADTELMARQVEEAKAHPATDATPANLKMAGAFMENAQPQEFSASWAFVLEPIEGGHTRLIERVRTRFGETDKPWTRFTLPVMGFGVFVMVRRQLLGIKARVEGHPMPRPEAVAAS